MNAQDKVCTYATQTQWFYWPCLQDMIGEEKDLHSTYVKCQYDIMEKHITVMMIYTQYHTTYVRF